MEIVCNYCGKTFNKYLSQVSGIKKPCCSFACRSLLLKDARIPVKCDCCGKDYKVIKSRYNKDKQHYCSSKCSFKYMTGPLAPRYKDGSTAESEAHRKKLKKWKLAVMKRDEFTCQKCGKVGGTLNVHHILAFSRFPNARDVDENGATLSKGCHQDFHKLYGTLKFTDKDYWEWLDE